MQTLKYVSVALILVALPAMAASGPTSTKESPPASNPEAPYAATSASATAPASSVAAQSGGAGAIPALPLDVQSKNGISYLTGGVSDEEEAELKAKKSEFNLHVLMSAPAGAYVSNVMTRILDNKGAEILSADNTGPYFYAKLPAGTYSVEMTTTQGGSKKFAVKVPTKGSARDQHVTFQE
jgi:hypothetical protein